MLWIAASIPTMKPTPAAMLMSILFRMSLTIARTPVTTAGINSGAKNASCINS
ncbi:hypothetical protein ACIQB4_29825 [Streptomyces griseoluteus]|uniref:hypothetical protein n=1 Tax=Streptomyces griseoluteus TaxID=29306 RepID=UPI00382EA371